MKILFKFLQRDTRGRLRTTEIIGEVKGDAGRLATLRDLLEAEHAINAHTSIRCHIEEITDEKSDGPSRDH